MTQCNSMSSSPISTAAPQPEEKLLAKETLLHLVAGGSAGQIICYELDNVYIKLANIEVCSILQGSLEVCIMHPLDLVKTRIQIQSMTPGGAGSVAETAHYRIVK